MFVCEETSPPARERIDCDYESAGWRCNATGFMGFAEGALHPAFSSPCPQCNTAFFLETARRRAQAAESPVGPCPCCGPGVAAMAYEAALATARSINPEATSAFLARLARG